VKVAEQAKQGAVGEKEFKSQERQDIAKLETKVDRLQFISSRNTFTSLCRQEK
jgi:hypothetical protein